MMQNSKKAISYLIAATLLLAVNYYHNVNDFPYDASIYWKLATLPDTLQSHEIIRGYLFPLLMGSGVKLFTFLGLDHIHSFRVLSALVYAYILSIQLPSVFIKLFGGNDSLLRRILPSVFFALVFPGLLIYPLSDVPALAFMWGAAYFASLSFEENLSERVKISALFASGFFSAAAYNTRTIYLFSSLLLFAFLIYFHRKNIRPLALFLAGIIVVTLPQINFNSAVHGISSPNPAISMGDQSLFTRQLTWGLTVQKYETNISPRTQPGVRYLDPEGEALLKKINAIREIRDVGDYLHMVFLFPFDFSKLYFRHFINGIDVRDGLAYISSPPSDRRMASYFNVLLLLGGLSVLFSNAMSNFQRQHKLMTAASLRTSVNAGILLLPAIVIIPSAVETRFFLPLHCLLYLVLAMKFSASNFQNLNKKGMAILSVMAAVFIGLFSIVSKSTMKNNAVQWIGL